MPEKADGVGVEGRETGSSLISGGDGSCSSGASASSAEGTVPGAGIVLISTEPLLREKIKVLRESDFVILVPRSLCAKSRIGLCFSAAWTSAWTSAGTRNTAGLDGDCGVEVSEMYFGVGWGDREGEEDKSIALNLPDRLSRLC